MFRKKQGHNGLIHENTKLLQEFKSNVAKQQTLIGVNYPLLWKYYEAGDESKAPVVMIGPAGSTPEFFFKLFLNLPKKGIRLIAVQPPPVLHHDHFIVAFENFLNYIGVQHVHLLGCGLGGFLIMLYARIHNKRVLSSIFINSFASNIGLQTAINEIEMLPAFTLRNYLSRWQLKFEVSDYNNTQDLADQAAYEFFKDRMNELKQVELFSALCLQSREAFIDKRKLRRETTTIIETDKFTNGPYAQTGLGCMPAMVRTSCGDLLNRCRFVTLKDGWDFPVIANSDEICLHIEVHLRRLDQSLLPVLRITNKPKEENPDDVKNILTQRPDDGDSESDIDDEPRPSYQSTAPRTQPQSKPKPKQVDRSKPQKPAKEEKEESSDWEWEEQSTDEDYDPLTFVPKPKTKKKKVKPAPVLPTPAQPAETIDQPEVHQDEDPLSTGLLPEIPTEEQQEPTDIHEEQSVETDHPQATEEYETEWNQEHEYSHEQYETQQPTMDDPTEQETDQSPYEQQSTYAVEEQQPQAEHIHSVPVSKKSRGLFDDDDDFGF
ncbi:putative maspardin [Blattamonas nauphoetae]|uniref:Maspardin n=1 Tax=Blattamonas nauphoetae TaxID=2049346 RepID=A0ABQ9XB10_9EUKA|nr:putative maspardin [Blattamonas nauphoetae]